MTERHCLGRIMGPARGILAETEPDARSSAQSAGPNNCESIGDIVTVEIGDSATDCEGDITQDWLTTSALISWWSGRAATEKLGD
jgi:hypothetical protein